jgi:TDG/mug DNA glycosylase family protein
VSKDARAGGRRSAERSPTIDVYEQRAREWQEARAVRDHKEARSFGRAAHRARRELGLTGPVLDAGCGPGPYTADLGRPVIAFDAAHAMLELVPEEAPFALRVQGDLAALPFRRHGLRAAWASKSYVHLPRAQVPMALHDLHRSLAVGSPVELVLFEGDMEHGTFAHDEFPGRSFSTWPAELLRAVVEGAGFEVEHMRVWHTPQGFGHHVVRAVRARTLADTVGPDMRLLLCGLNPSVYSADVGSGFARPGNRFWPAALAAGIVDRPRDPLGALRRHGVGMTDVVKRATARADELTPDEYRSGMQRLERLAAWLRPAAICFVGLAGWRTAVNRKATSGWQDHRIGGCPTYVMPNTSGLNASSSLADLTEHLRIAAAG